MTTVASGYSFYTIPGDGVTDTFPLQFALGVLKLAYVLVYVDGEVDGEGAQVYRQIESVPGDPGMVKVLGAVVPPGVNINFQRIVPKDLLIHLYSNGSVLNYPSLDESHKQLAMMMHEVLDGIGLKNVFTDINMNGFKITNIYTDLDDPESVATVGALGTYRADAAQYAAAAAASSTEAQGFANDATAQAALASTSASVAAAHAGDADSSAAAAALSADEAASAVLDAEAVVAQAALDLGTAGVPIGAEFAWCADPLDPLGAIPAGYVLAAGQELSRATYPSLFAFASVGGRMLSDSAWLAQEAAQDGNVGLYSDGDGSTTFRMPKVGCFIRVGTPDKTGSFEGDAIRNITGTIKPSNQSTALDMRGAVVTGAFTPINPRSLSVFAGTSSAFSGADIGFDAALVVPTADENRPKTIYRTLIVKAFGAAVNSGSVDVQQLASDVSAAVATVQEMELDETLSLSRMLHAADIKPQGTQGGSSIAGLNQRTLNTLLHNTIVGAELTENVVTVPAGKYYVEATTPTVTTNGSKLLVRDAGSGDTLLVGTNAFSSDNAEARSVVSGTITLAAPTGIALYHYTRDAVASQGLGVALNISGYTEHYSDLKLWRIA